MTQMPPVAAVPRLVGCDRRSGGAHRAERVSCGAGLPNLAMTEVSHAVSRREGARRDSVIGEVIALSLVPDPTIRWGEDQVLAAVAALRAVGLDATGSLRLLSWSRVASKVLLGVAVGAAFDLDRRQLDAALRACDYSLRERRAVLGLPPQ